MTVQVKICGLTRPEDAAAVLSAGADFAGLVFHPRSARHLRPDQAGAIAQHLRGRVGIVALLVDPVDDALVEIIGAVKPDWIQLHGRETPRRVAEVRARFATRVIKALGISDQTDLQQIAGQERVADMLLFDVKPSAGDTAGGNGRAFDWKLLRGLTVRKPWLLAGGLNAGNVAAAIRSANAPGVDVSSGVETAPGIKDADAIRAFVTHVRNDAAAKESPS
ncbi:MAG TPA: phosphoribosylanthranilate isomerase [Rhizomicrobium sp.]|jgi:phosphoribosylanthranilate isomerase